MTNEQIKVHPSEFAQLQSNTLNATASAVLGAVVSLGCLVSLHYVPAQFKLPLSGFAAAVAIAAQRSNKVSLASQRIARDWLDVGDAQRTNRLYQGFAPGAKSAAVVEELPAPYTPALFDFQQLVEKRNKFPHFLYVASTGSGKTTTNEYLFSQLPGVKIALSPHYEAGADWLGYRVVSARDIERTHGGNYHEWMQSLSDGDEVVLGAGRDFESIAQAIAALLQIMNDRYNDPQYKRLPPIECSIDELPALAREQPDAMGDILKLCAEARKRMIRIHLLTQSSTVKSLGIEGQGDMRENFVFIRLGEMATNHAKKLVKDGEEPEGLLDWVKAQEWPAFVDDSPAILPDIQAWKTQIARSLRIETMQIQNTLPAVETNGSGHYAPLLRTYAGSTVQLEAVPGVTVPGYFEPTENLFDDGIGVSAVAASDSEPQNSELEQAIAALEMGKSKTFVIKEVLRYQGRNYSIGKAIVEQAEQILASRNPTQ